MLYWFTSSPAAAAFWSRLDSHNSPDCDVGALSTWLSSSWTAQQPRSKNVMARMPFLSSLRALRRVCVGLLRFMRSKFSKQVPLRPPMCQLSPARWSGNQTPARSRPRYMRYVIGYRNIAWRDSPRVAGRFIWESFPNGWIAAPRHSPIGLVDWRVIPEGRCPFAVSPLRRRLMIRKVSTPFRNCHCGNILLMPPGGGRAAGRDFIPRRCLRDWP